MRVFVLNILTWWSNIVLFIFILTWIHLGINSFLLSLLVPSCLSLSHEIPFLLMFGHGNLAVFMQTTGMKNWWNYSVFGWKGPGGCWTKGLAGRIGGALTGEALRCVLVARECGWTTGLLLGGHKGRARTISMETPAKTSSAFQPLLTFGLGRVFQIRHVLVKRTLANGRRWDDRMLSFGQTRVSEWA